MGRAAVVRAAHDRLAAADDVGADRRDRADRACSASGAARSRAASGRAGRCSSATSRACRSSPRSPSSTRSACSRSGCCSRSSPRAASSSRRTSACSARSCPELVGEEHGDVAAATALFQAANRLTIFLGPPLAGVLIARDRRGEHPLRRRRDLPRVVRARRRCSSTRPRSTRPRTAAARSTACASSCATGCCAIWQPAFTLLDVCWTVFFASLPVLVVTQLPRRTRTCSAGSSARSAAARWSARSSRCASCAASSRWR